MEEVGVGVGGGGGGWVAVAAGDVVERPDLVAGILLLRRLEA